MKLNDLEVLRELSDQELAVQAGAAPGLSVDAKSTKLSLQDCIDKATLGLVREGYTNISSGTGSNAFGNGSDFQFGFYGDYVAAITCVDPRDLVFISVAGPSQNIVTTLGTKLLAKF